MGRLIKAGAVPKDLEAKLANISAWAELVGYAANIYLSLVKLAALNTQEARIADQMIKAAKVSRRRPRACTHARYHVSTYEVWATAWVWLVKRRA